MAKGDRKATTMMRAGWIRALGILTVLAVNPGHMVGGQVGSHNDHLKSAYPSNATHGTVVYMVAPEPDVLGVLQTSLQQGGYSVTVSRSVPSAHWDLAWTFDPNDAPRALERHQRVNHFPGKEFTAVSSTP